MTQYVSLRQLAHGRAGDKGDTLNISVIARHAKHFEHLVSVVTIEHCKNVFSDRNIQQLDRYILPKLHAMNFVLVGVLDGGVNRSLHVDRHGKTLSSLLLDSQIPLPTEL